MDSILGIPETMLIKLYYSVCVAGVVRVVFLYKHTHSNDPSWTIAPVFMWSCVEPFIGIVCACLPTFSPLFRRWWAILGGKKGSKKQEDYYGGGSQTRRSRQQRSEDEEDGPHGDEVQLTSFPGWPLNFLRGKGRDDARLSNSNIRVKEEITISFSVGEAT